MHKLGMGGRVPGMKLSQYVFKALLFQKGAVGQWALFRLLESFLPVSCSDLDQARSRSQLCHFLAL